MHKYCFQVLYSKVSTLTKQLCYKSVFVRVSMFSYFLEWIDKGCKARWLALSPQSNSKEVCMFSPCLRGRFFSPAVNMRLVQDLPCALACDSWDGLKPHCDPELDKQKRWMNGFDWGTSCS